MSRQAIQEYYANLDRAVHFAKTRNEDTIKSFFWMLLNQIAHDSNYEVVREVYCQGTKGSKVKPDGIVRNLWGLDVGYWESKDEKDNIQDEIDVKIKKGYPLNNILFEDSQTAVLYQYGAEAGRASVRDEDKLLKILTQFFSYRSEAVNKFEEALKRFKIDIPAILETLRARIETVGDQNPSYLTARTTFLELCKTEINPDITLADVREMMIQHILTSDIFNKIFDEPDFLRHNNVARELESLIGTLFTYSDRRNLLHSIEHYYDAINAAAASIADHHEKQKFLKVLYENFYKVYNPKAADRLGVVYTPNEIVEFMIDGADHLLQTHFGKTLADKNVEILDPATGTATFICDIIEHIPGKDLAYKYKNEIHANEVAILPYYIANLNIEYTFKQKMGYYEEFPNICFVDTLDNIAGLSYKGQQNNLFGFSSENSERIKRQNQKKISVIIGNPPYNANQKNENENNKNREYPHIDKRLKETYIKQSTAQKTKLYDMYARFYRWASDRVDKNGIIAFITNRSFINSRTFDGFRKCIEIEFSDAYIIDTKSDVRMNPKIAGTTHNVFGIQTGVAIMFLVKRQDTVDKCRIRYTVLEDEWRKEEKLHWLKNNKLSSISFSDIKPDKNCNWIDLNENDWDHLLPIIDKDQKRGKMKNSIFTSYTIGISTNRDEWVVDLDDICLQNKMKYFCNFYDSFKGRPENDNTIKWSSSLKQRFANGLKETFEKEKIVKFNYRPFVPAYLFFSKLFIDRQGLANEMFSKINPAICISGNGSTKPFQTLSVNRFSSLDILEKTQIIPMNVRKDSRSFKPNITDWGLEQFQKHYKNKNITKEEIFHYVYGVLHDPVYRATYEINLKREFPRIPFYKNFKQWSVWGKELMDLHVNYEKAPQYSFTRVDIKPEKIPAKKTGAKPAEKASRFAYVPDPKPKLKADKSAGTIELDDVTLLKGIPPEAWEYKLGNRSALEWVLDQYKEKKPTDPTIAEKFNTYRFVDYKERVIELLKRVTSVSVRTMEITGKMKDAVR